MKTVGLPTENAQVHQILTTISRSVDFQGFGSSRLRTQHQSGLLISNLQSGFFSSKEDLFYNMSVLSYKKGN